MRTSTRTRLVLRSWCLVERNPRTKRAYINTCSRLTYYEELGTRFHKGRPRGCRHGCVCTPLGFTKRPKQTIDTKTYELAEYLIDFYLESSDYIIKNKKEENEVAVKPQTTQAPETKPFTLAGLTMPVFIPVTLVIAFAAYRGWLPNNMIGGWAFMIALGAILNEIGNRLPIVKDYLGGGPIVIIFGSAAMVTYNLMPASAEATVRTFMNAHGFLNWYIAALITGSILGMDRDLLIKASARYIPAIAGGIVLSLTLVALVGGVIGFGWKEALLFIGVPIMGGGMGAGAVPLSQIYAGPFGRESTDILSVMIPAVAMGNALAIVSAGLLNRIGKIKTSLSGEGQLMQGAKAQAESQKMLKKDDRLVLDLEMMGVGLFLASAFFILGVILEKFIPSIHAFALMIISVAIVKALGVMPRKYEIGAYQWFQFVMKNLTGALLIGIGVAFTNLQQIIDAFTIQYVLLVAVTVIGGIIGAGFIGKLVGFYPIESSITAGLCMANMGGTGDVATLSASDRMELMPFAQISSRIGGAMMLILASFLTAILL